MNDAITYNINASEAFDESLWNHLAHAASGEEIAALLNACLLYTSPSPRDS